MGYALPAVDFAIRLADEGVPLRAIARATKIPSEQLRITLEEAIDDGRLIELPREDWPPGFPRDQRALQLSRMLSEDQHALVFNVQKIFHFSPAEAALLLALVQNVQVSKTRNDMAYKSIDVYICRMRKALEPFQIEIKTLWGYGYQIQMPDRRKIMDLILACVHEPQTQTA
jgi:hypothetical protein